MEGRGFTDQVLLWGAGRWEEAANGGQCKRRVTEPHNTYWHVVLGSRRKNKRTHNSHTGFEKNPIIVLSVEVTRARMLHVTGAVILLAKTARV